MTLRTRITHLLGIEYPIIQGGMSWAAGPELVAAVSEAGGLGVIGAGPMYPDVLRESIRRVKAATAKPFAVNVPLTRDNADELAQIVLEEQVPVLVASQGGPERYVDKFKAAGRTCLHVVASARHAEKAQAAGVDAVIVVGAEAGGHPGPDEVTTLVLVRRVARAVSIPVVAAGGIADGAGIAAVLCLGAEGAQLGTRFLMTREAAVHEGYKEAVRLADVHDTALVGRGLSPARMLRNQFAQRYLAAERSGLAREQLSALFKESTLKMAAREGNTAMGKVEAGQAAGLIDDLPSAAEVVTRLVLGYREAVARLPGE